MEELVKLVAEKTGMPEASAKKAVETVLAFLKERLPDPIADRLDDVVEGAGKLDLDQINDIAKNLGGLFGKK